METTELKVLVKLNQGNSRAPLKMGVNDAGHDLYTVEPVILHAGERKAVDTGISLAIPDGWFGKIEDRSGKALSGLKVSGGILDSSYRGVVKVILQNVNPNGGPAYLQVGDRIAQLVFLPVPKVTFEVVEELPDTERGEGGFGSTGK